MTFKEAWRNFWYVNGRNVSLIPWFTYWSDWVVLFIFIIIGLWIVS